MLYICKDVAQIISYIREFTSENQVSPNPYQKFLFRSLIRAYSCLRSFWTRFQRIMCLFRAFTNYLSATKSLNTGLLHGFTWNMQCGIFMQFQFTFSFTWDLFLRFTCAVTPWHAFLKSTLAFCEFEKLYIYIYNYTTANVTLS